MRHGHLTLIAIVGVVSLVIGAVSLYLQLHPWSNASAYQQTIQDSCTARGYEHSTFTDDAPACCRQNYCVNYTTAMHYGPGYEPSR